MSSDTSRTAGIAPACDAYVTAIQRYASVMLADARAFAGYHAWQVYVRTVAGTTYLPEEWHRP